jgi:hypothetical protein
MSVAALIIWSLVTLAPAQQTTSTHPALDASDLYLSFFFFHEDFAKWTESRVTANPSKETQFLNSSAKFLGISPSEFRTLEAITSQTTASLRALSAEAQTAIQAILKSKKTLDPATLAAYDARRQALIQTGIDQMKATLSPQSWQGLSSYINNQHRQNVKYGSPAASVAY